MPQASAIESECAPLPAREGALAHTDQSALHNRLLRALDPEEFALLAPHLVPQSTRLREPLIEPGATIETCYFVETGIVSVVTARAGSRIEIGMIGREGLVGAAPVLLGDARSPHEHFVQMAGEVLAMSATTLAAIAEAHAGLRRRLLRYVEAQLVQVSETAHANAMLGLESRLARWLLMCHDRVGDDELVFTHEFMSMMLGVHRAGLTLTLQNLEGARHIRCRRRRIRILDRARLEALTEGCYGVAESEYARLVEGR